MTEAFLHYLWQFQYFDKANLKTTENEELIVFKTGHYNTHAGPDFTQAKIKIGSLEWIGNVEVHVKASEWTQHKHQHDKAYDNVVLHLVWQQDKVIYRSDGSTVPTLELKGRVNNQLLLKHKKLINHPAPIACAGIVKDVPPLIKLSTLEQSFTHRLETKANAILGTLQNTNNDWEETCYQTLGKNFGFKVNNEAFQKLTEIVPYKIVLKHADKIHQVEALLLGTAGLLGPSKDAYCQLLSNEYKLLSQKYDLASSQLHKSQWRFLRLRPANFPTIRISHFANLLCKTKNIFSQIIAAETVTELKQIFDITQSTYWQQHYLPGKPAAQIIPGLGEMASSNIIINTVAPILTAYSLQKDESLWTERAVHFLSHLPPENNSIIREWKSIGWSAATAFDSQAQIELKNNFCSKRHCLRCSIGTFIMKPE